MMLGRQQIETLTFYALLLKRSPEIIRLVVHIEPYREYTRECGSGHAITVTAFECYEEGDYKMRSSWVANCQFDYTAEDKGREIARWLVAQGCPKKRIRLTR